MLHLPPSQKEVRGRQAFVQSVPSLGSLLRLQATHVVVQCGATPPAKRIDQRCDQAHAGVEEGQPASSSSSTAKRVDAALTLPFDPFGAKLGGRLHRLNARHSCIFGGHTFHGTMRLPKSFARQLLPDPATPSIPRTARAVSHLLTVRDRHQDRAFDLRQRRSDSQGFHDLDFQHIPATTSFQRSTWVPSRQLDTGRIPRELARDVPRGTGGLQLLRLPARSNHTHA
jgi:hypothetical protein